MDFDFDAWAKLARENPEDFERRREAVLRAAIEAAPVRHRRRLQGLQFQIDLERQRAGSALGACIKLNSMMWASFFKLRDELNEAVDGTPRAAPSKASAEVIPMHRYARNRYTAAPGEN